MPTNLLRAASRKPVQRSAAPAPVGARRILLRAGRTTLRLELLATATADRIWAALPIHSTAETWGASVHFEIPAASGRERGAKLNVAPGEICFWSEDQRVLVAWGATPISGADSGSGAIRLPSPCNVWARALDDVAALASVRPGEKVSMTAATEGGERLGP